MQTPFKSTKHKSWKQKLQELRDIATGRKTIESIVEASRPKRFVSVMEENGIYTVEGNQLNQEQFDAWRESQKGNIISIKTACVFLQLKHTASQSVQLYIFTFRINKNLQRFLTDCL